MVVQYQSFVSVVSHSLLRDHLGRIRVRRQASNPHQAIIDPFL